MQRRNEIKKLSGCITCFQEADNAIRNYALYQALGIRTDGDILDNVFDSLGDLEPYIADAKEGHILQLPSDRLIASEVRQFLKYGQKILDTDTGKREAGTPDVENIFLFESESKDKILTANEKYQAYEILYLTLCYLARLKNISYVEITNNRDVKVSTRMEMRKSFWQINLTPEHVILRLKRIHQTVLNVSIAPQLIFNSREALELCHFVGLVSKLGEIAAPEVKTRKKR